VPAYPNASTAQLTEALGGNISSATAVSEVTRRLLDFFTSGGIDVGHRLPPERQLAQSMGVGRSAVREALAALEILGVVDVRPGSGTYLRGRISELLPQTLSWGMLLGEPKTRELIGVRHGLEVQATRLAATTITDESLAVMAEHLDTMKANMENFTDFVAADMRFHQQLASSADNTLLDEMLQSVRSLLRVWVERALNDSDHAQLTCNEHETILAALRQHDPQAAADAMSAHMDSAGRRLTASFDAA
jgi:GntR family transcriptional regulator, transcriptional repressor for pyruvate dehydrogenase complex